MEIHAAAAAAAAAASCVHTLAQHT